MTKYSFSPAPKRSVSPAPPQQPRPFDLDHQMRLFMVEKRSAGLHQQLSSHPTTHTRIPSYKTQKQLPVTPSPPRKLLRLASKHFNAPSSGGKVAAAAAICFNPSNRTVTRTELRPVPHPSRRTPSSVGVTGASSSAPSLISPGERVLDAWQNRPSSFIAPETPNDVFWTALKTPEMALPPRAWVTPENSPLLPPPRDGRRSADLRVVPPPIHVVHLRRPGSPPVKRRELRAKTGGIFESVLGKYPRHVSARSNPEILITHNVNGISPRRITIDSIDRPPRTPPPPPPSAKSRAQKERARVSATTPVPSTTPVGYVAELAGSIPPVELMGDVEFPVIMAPVPHKKPRVKASNVKSRVKHQQQQRPVLERPDGMETYARLPLPEIPTERTSPISTPPTRSCGSSPVIEVDLGFDDGLVEWFNNFNWSGTNAQISPPNSAHSTSSTNTKTNTPTLRIPPAPGSPPSTTFPHDTRASVVNPNGAITTCEPPPKSVERHDLFAVSTALLSPVFPVSPRFASYYGERASLASSVGDAFRFDEEGDALSDVDERYEEELDVDELYGFNREEQYINEGAGGYYEGQEITPGNSLDSRLQYEIEMMLNGGYSPDDWRDGIYSAGSSSDASGEDQEDEIVVGLDISTDKEESWHERPRTRYIAGRNSAIDGDVVFCLRGVDSM